MPAGCRECSPAEEYEGEQPSCFKKRIKIKLKKYGRLACPVQEMQSCRGV